MIKNTVFNFSKVRNHCGKYAVKYDNIFQLLETYQNKLPDNWFFKPIRAEIELTNICNQKCHNCGMSDAKIDNSDLDVKNINIIVSELNKCKIPSIALTGGEPFINIELLCYTINLCINNNIDISKITTNAFWGINSINIDNIFKMLINNGLLSNKMFVPLLMMSIGEQTIPLEYINNIIHYVENNFSNKIINLCISSLCCNGIHKTNLLKNKYNDRFNMQFPDNKIYVTYSNYVGNIENKNIQKKYKLLDLVEECYMCFDQCVGSYILPTILIKKNGNIYACSCFNVPSKYFFLGNIYNNTLINILANANKNPYIKIIKENSIRGLLDYISINKKKILSELYVDSYCEACQILLDNIELNND